MKLAILIEHVYPKRVLKELREMASAIENLRREVAEARAGQDSAVALIEGLRDRLDEMLTSTESFAELQREVDSLSQDLSASTDKLAAAVVEPAPDEVPAEEPADETPSEPAPLELDENGVPVGTGGPGVQPSESEGPVENGNVNPGEPAAGADETP